MREGKEPSLKWRIGLAVLALVLATAVWLPCVHLFYEPRLDDYHSLERIPPKARALAEGHLRLWTNSVLRAQELKRMRASNAEWDFMGRTFLVLALSNMALREPMAQDGYLRVIDQIIDNTLELENRHGLFHFLMDYARAREFVVQPPRTLFEDGEIALMLGARRLVREKREYEPLFQQRVETILARMRASPVLSAESYPDECWTFCNAVALAAIKLSDVLDGTDHSEFLKGWVRAAKRHLVHEETGLLVSAFTFTGEPLLGPEGSSIWMAAHCLQIVDPGFASDQYARARSQLAKRVLGFGYAREWPESWGGAADVDSGPIVPVLQASAGSSGLAIMGASAFGDTAFLHGLLTTLNLAGFPVQQDGTLRYCASNQVGDAVLLYALVLGPLWEKVGELETSRGPS